MRGGVEAGDRIATLAWNGYRHVELYFGVSGMEAVCHTLNPRLHRSQLIYIVNHAEDRYLFTDLTFLPLVEAIAEQLKTVEGAGQLFARCVQIGHAPTEGDQGNSVMSRKFSEKEVAQERS